MKEIRFLLQSGVDILHLDPPCQLGSLYGMEFRISFDLKHNLPSGDERISALSFDCLGFLTESNDSIARLP